MPEYLILVDENDNPVGTEEKIKAHEDGTLHRCFSIFIFNDKGELMLQQRALGKYHSAGLWTNTCCGHPRPGENTTEAAHRRLKEEMGFICELVPAFSFVYKAPFDNGLTEHEFDHVFIGRYNKDPILNREEANDFKWVDLKWLEKDIKENPARYSFWLKNCFTKLVDYLGKSLFI